MFSAYHKDKTHRRLAEKMAADMTCAHRAAAEQMLQLMDDPEALKAQVEAVQQKVHSLTLLPLESACI